MTKNDDTVKAHADEPADRVRRLLSMGAFTTPLLGSFALNALTIEKASAISNTTSSKIAD